MNTKVLENKYFRIVLNLLLAFSFAMLSFYNLVGYTMLPIIFTLMLSFCMGLYVFNHIYDKGVKYIVRNKKSAMVILIISLIIVYEMYITKGLTNYDIIFANIPIHFFRFRYFLLAVPGLFIVLIILYKVMVSFLRELFGKLDSTDKKNYLTISIISILLIFIVYKYIDVFYMGYDNIYSLDSGFCFSAIYPNFSYFDIRHPIYSIFAFPMYAIFNFISKIVIPMNLRTVFVAACVQVINVQFLIITGFVIKSILKNRFFLVVYFTSFSFLLYSLNLEKYNIVVFLMAVYIFYEVNKKEHSEIPLVLGIGTMPPNAFMIFEKLLRKESIKDKAKYFLRFVLFGVFTLVFAGKVFLLNPIATYGLVTSTQNSYGNLGYSLSICIKSFINMVQGVFVSLSSYYSEGCYLWTDVLNNISLIGVLILIVVIIGIIKTNRSVFKNILFTTVLESVILIIGFQWAIDVSPLFSICFAFAYTVFFTTGFEWIINKFKLNKKISYSVYGIAVLSLNCLRILDIFKAYI